MSGSAHRTEWTAAAGALCVAGALVLALRAAVVRDPSRPNFEFFPDMVRGPAAQSQSDGAATPDGFSEQALPDGVVVRDVRSFAFGATPEEAERAGRELANPFQSDDAAARDRGALVFARFCTPCHGADGEGHGPAVLRGMLPPPSLKAERAVKMRDGQMFHVVTKGQGNMASYAVQVAPDDRWKSILHVRSLQGAQVR
jgi:mono/diheme cytochrome c family protein